MGSTQLAIGGVVAKGQPEPSLLAVARDRDEAFEGLYRQEWAPLVRLAFALTGNRAVAEELVQETFLRAYRHWRTVSGAHYPSAWLRRVLVNLATSRGRRLQAEARVFARLGRRRGLGAEPHLAAEVAEFWGAVRRLPARQAAVVALYYGEDRSVADVAGLLGTAEGTVRAQLHSARKTLASQLGLIDEPEPDTVEQREGPR